jgi:hypothetical protein
MVPKVLIVPLLLLVLTLASIDAGEEEYNQLVSQMESDVKELAQKVERLYRNRCNGTSLKACALGNYDDCVSSFPNPVCLGNSSDLNIAQCSGNGVTCSTLWDYTISIVRLSNAIADSGNKNPSDPRVIETVCFTQALDDFFVQKREEQKPVWDKLGLSTPLMFFGAQNGAFRIYPAHPVEKCGQYDPRLRPWYIAASSGPKNVVLMLDTSYSMSGRRLDLMKEAAKQVIKTLTTGDRIAIVHFSGGATIIGQDNAYLLTASLENKDMLEQRIDDLDTSDGTNFQDAFKAAFQVMNDSIDREFHVACTTAILFLTDGEMNQPSDVTEQSVLTLVNSGIMDLEERVSPVFLFTYSISDSDNAVHAFPKQIACSTGDNGVWSKIVNENEIFDSLTSYYRLFSLGLGQDNETFVAWVDPYPSYVGNILVTTVSSPVYDRSLTPPLFLGVAGIDFSVAAVDAALDVPGGSQDSIDRIVRQSTAVCPTVKLELCELESFRQSGAAGSDALCTATCNKTDFVSIEETQCSAADDYPKDLWANRDLTGVSYTQRACCVAVDISLALTGQCLAFVDQDVKHLGAIIGGAIGGGVALLLGVCMLIKYKKKSNSR